jgi:hypothetical protein
MREGTWPVAENTAIDPVAPAPLLVDAAQAASLTRIASIVEAVAMATCLLGAMR